MLYQRLSGIFFARDTTSAVVTKQPRPVTCRTVRGAVGYDIALPNEPCGNKLMESTAEASIEEDASLNALLLMVVEGPGSVARDAVE
jgi:hypothetical protein